MASRQQVGLLLAVAAPACAGVVAAAAQQGDIGSRGVCTFADKSVVNACFKSFGQGMKMAPGPRGQVDCCVAFGGHGCLCEMKNAWAAANKASGAQNNVECVRNKAC